MGIEILNALLEMVKLGGVYAIWGVAIWTGIQLLKVLVVLAFLFGVVKVICTTILSYQSRRIHNITLISEALSAELKDSLTSFVTETQSVVSRLNTELENLSKNSNKT